ncbi:MAG: DUF1963 domain-containing protein [Butyrivibrio sp.]|nr:DUF1963 domain-containing protein [Butyrivibrio sp.]
MDNKEELKKIILEKVRNEIQLDVQSSNDSVTVTSSKIGGKPSVPEGFVWPTYHADYLEKDEPLAFLAQFNLEELAPYDKDGLFPKKGMLSFFYCLLEDDLLWGTDPRDKGSARVFYFEDATCLKPIDFPEGAYEGGKITEKAVMFKAHDSYPTFDFLYDLCGGFDSDLYHECLTELGYINDCLYNDKLLGYAEYVQHSEEAICEKMYLGFDATNPPGQVITDEDKKAFVEGSVNWVQLFQLDPENESFDEMMCIDGFIHFFIRKEDLKNFNFDDIQYIVECG